MSGHNKWAQIKRQKAVTDGARSKVFARFAKMIALESKKANGSITAPSLAAVIARAKAANMPKDNIERAIKRGTGEAKDGLILEEIFYEGYAPNGIALTVCPTASSKQGRALARGRSTVSATNTTASAARIAPSASSPSSPALRLTAASSTSPPQSTKCQGFPA